MIPHGQGRSRPEPRFTAGTEEQYSDLLSDREVAAVEDITEDAMTGNVPQLNKVQLVKTLVMFALMTPVIFLGLCMIATVILSPFGIPLVLFGCGRVVKQIRKLYHIPSGREIRKANRR